MPGTAPVIESLRERIKTKLGIDSAIPELTPHSKFNSAWVPYTVIEVGDSMPVSPEEYSTRDLVVRTTVGVHLIKTAGSAKSARTELEELAADIVAIKEPAHWLGDDIYGAHIISIGQISEVWDWVGSSASNLDTCSLIMSLDVAL